MRRGKQTQNQQCSFAHGCPNLLRYSASNEIHSLIIQLKCYKYWLTKENEKNHLSFGKTS